MQIEFGKAVERRLFFDSDLRMMLLRQILLPIATMPSYFPVPVTASLVRKLLDFFAAQPSCTVALEACDRAHYRGPLTQIGHSRRLVTVPGIGPISATRLRFSTTRSRPLPRAATLPPGWVSRSGPRLFHNNREYGALNIGLIIGVSVATIRCGEPL
jgi:hypothetical protein